MSDKPYVLDGGLAIDDRGSAVFVNDFDFASVRRFYMVSNHRSNFVRAWHAHRHEAKYVTAVSGSAIIGAVKIDNWSTPSRDLPVSRWVLSSSKPQVIYIPPGYANGFMSLTSDTKLIFFSTSSFAQAKDDDVRYDARYWDIWQTIER